MNNKSGNRTFFAAGKIIAGAFDFSCKPAWMPV